MNKYCLAAALVAATGAVQAQDLGFSGGEISAEAIAYSDGDDIGATAYGAAVEFGITRQISVAVDLGFYGLQDIDLQAETATLHGIYQLSDTVSVGAFYGLDRTDGDDASLYGIEGGTEFAGVAVEGFVGIVDGDGDDATLLGVSGEYGFTDSITALGSFNNVSLVDGSITRLALGGQYEIANGPELWVEVGTLNAEFGAVSDAETFVSLGARIEFGADRGTTFGHRSLFESSLGF